MIDEGNDRRPETEPNGSRPRFDPRTQWRTILGWGLIVVGGVFIVLGWFGVSGDPHVARQLSYLASGGLGGLACVLVGIGLLLSEDMRADRRRLGRIEAAVLEVQDLLRAQLEAADGEVEDATERSAKGRRRSR